MSEMSIEQSVELQEALTHIDRAVGGIHTLLIGPLDYNVRTTVDDLLAAISRVEEFARRRRDRDEVR